MDSIVDPPPDSKTPANAERDMAEQIAGPAWHYDNKLVRRMAVDAIAPALSDQRAKYEAVADDLLREAHRAGNVYGADKRDAALRIRRVARG